jgi:hypothetical protein
MGNPDELQPLFLLSDEPIDSHATNAFENDPFARTVACAALGTKGPFTIGVYGGWGSGKTSALHASRTMIDADPAWSHVVTVEFNAWRFEREAHPIVPLVATIEREVAAKAAKLEAQGSGKHAEQIGWYKKAGMQCRAFLAGWQFKLKPEIGIPLIGKVAAEATWTAKDSLLQYAKLQEELRTLDGEHWSALRDSCLSLSVFDALDRVSDAVGHAAGDMSVNWPLVVVFIDDLDRCQADKAFELLESVKLVLCQPGFVFVLALNHAVVDGYLTYRAEKLYGKDHIKLHRSYLEKIVQLPLTMPSRSERFAGFAAHLIETRLSKAADPLLRDGLKRMAPLLALAADATPRTLVRTINGALLDIALRDPAEFPRELKSETPPYPKYTALCVVQRALERAIGADLTRELAQQDGLCAALLSDLTSGTYQAILAANSKGEQGKLEPAKPAFEWYDKVEELSSGSPRREEIVRLRAVVNAIEERAFLWKEQRDLSDTPTPGSALFTSNAGRYWLGNRAHRLAVMKAAVAAPVAQAGSLEGEQKSPVSETQLTPSRATDPETTAGVEEWMRAIAILGKTQRAAIERAACRNLELAPNAPLDEDAWGRVNAIKLTADPITDVGVAWLSHPDSGLRSLIELRISDTQVGDAGVAALAANDSGLRSLRKLELSGTQVGDAGAVAIAAEDTAIKDLAQLNLSFTGVGNAGAAALAAQNSGLKALRSLSLNGSQVTNAGLRELVRAETRLKGLTSLFLNFTRITDEGLTAIVDPDCGLTALTELGLEGTQVTDSGIEAVKARWPGIRIHR